jgi:hypothetical protein
MNIADPKYLEHLRDLPSSYLLDLLADNDDIDRESVFWVLQERGLTREELERKVLWRQKSLWPRPYQLWTSARWLTLFNTLVVTYFNLTSIEQLLRGDHALKSALLFLVAGSIIFGFIVGYKLTTHLYHGSKSLLYCGFPLPVGFVDLQTGEEILQGKKTMTLRMALNALVGVSLTLFPLILLYVKIK